MLSKTTDFRIAAETYLRSRHDLEEPTKVGYRKTFTRFSKVYETLGDLTAQNLNDHLDAIQHAPTMARNDCIALRGMGKWATKVGVFKVNPLASVELPKGRGGTREPFKDNEVRPIINAAQDSALGFRDKAIVVVGLACGLRPSENWLLDVSDVDTKEGWITVRKSKTKAGERTIPLDPQAVAAIEEYLAYRPDVDGALWLNNHGDPFRYWGFMSVFRRLTHKLEAKGIHYTAYRGRHTAITNMVRVGTEGPIVKQMAGHKSIVTTQRYIGTIGRADLARIPRAFSAIYGRAV